MMDIIISSPSDTSAFLDDIIVIEHSQQELQECVVALLQSIQEYTLVFELSNVLSLRPPSNTKDVFLIKMTEVRIQESFG
ncbi:unnamed protein product [Hymenolepis diminuta]|uniref:Reverse transcriptase domain-containing protein n=1 Tax=Hymenolepis diminuta TaxID=6216 RepID=A0A0R3SRJ0_HYMDI|nr:unnamed protein product [Hymenolepis diminuta]